jgi:hypothetical protein
VLKRRNEEESKVADAFIAERGDPGSKEQIAVSRPRRAAAQPPGRRASLPAGRGFVDLSWKDGGSSYPKRSSRLGDEYQATMLPSVGSRESDWGEGSDF